MLNIEIYTVTVYTLNLSSAYLNNEYTLFLFKFPLFEIESTLIHIVHIYFDNTVRIWIWIYTGIDFDSALIAQTKSSVFVISSISDSAQCIGGQSKGCTVNKMLSGRL